MRSIFMFVCFILVCNIFFAQNLKVDSLYLNQQPPGNNAELFAPEIISMVGRYEHDICFSPNGKEVFFTLSDENWMNFTIFYSYWNGSSWSDIDTSSFSKKYKNTEISFAPNGQSVYFASSRTPGNEPWNFGIFKSHKSNNTYSQPQEIGIKQIQPSGNDGNWHPTVSADSTVFFSSYKSGNYDIYYSELIDGSYAEFINLGDPVNSNSNDYYPWISADKKMLIFSSDRAGGYGKGDLYISFKNDNNEWSNPVNMGQEVNSADDESCPRITYDGDYFFFTRTKNWDGDIYWVDAGFIEKLKETEPSIIRNSVGNLKNIQVFPNPSFGEITISNPQSSNEVLYKLFDRDGRLIIDGVLEEKEQILDLTFLTKGVYMLRFESEGVYENAKILLF